MPSATSKTLAAKSNTRKRFSLYPFSARSQAVSLERGNGDDKSKLASLTKISREDQEAFACAVSIRTLAVPPTMNRAAQPPASFKRIHNNMMDPKTAAAIVRHLSRMPCPGDSAAIPAIEDIAASEKSKPIRAISLSETDEEVDKLFSSRLRASPKFHLAVNGQTAPEGPVAIHNATLASIIDTVKDLKAPSLLEDAGNSGSVNYRSLARFSFPDASALAGLGDIAKSLLDFGYATDEIPHPDIKDVHPPSDRISLLCYWWGYELCLPHASMEVLAKVDSVVTTLSRVLTAIALVSAEVAAILPVIHFIASAIDSEWNSIKEQDKGKGVVCTATWCVPVALTTRSWDFPPAPTKVDKATSP